jgi:HK97 gp10 family phage protein
VASVTIKVEGLKELGQKFAQLSDDMQKKVARSATNAAAQVVKKIAIRKAPVSSPEMTPNIPPGHLKKNIIVKRSRLRNSNLTSEHRVTVKGRSGEAISPYRVGIFQEYGTVKHGPQPFMRPAIDQGKSGAIEAMKKKIKERIDKANRGGK